jgi:hypothetical protein
MPENLCVPYVCFRMFCPNCLEDGWHQSWCDDAGKSEVTGPVVQGLPWVWTPAIPAVHPALPWSPGAMEEGVEMFPQLYNTGIIMDGTGNVDNEVNVVCEDATAISGVYAPIEGATVDSEIDSLREGATLNSESVAGDVMISEAGEGATEESGISWDLVEEVVRNNETVTLSNQEEERKELENCVEDKSQGRLCNTPVEMDDTPTDDVEKLWRDAKELAEALTRYVTKEGLSAPLIGGVKAKKGHSMASSSQGRCNECEGQKDCHVHTPESPTSPGPDEYPDREWGSDTSESRDEPYRPVVSAISSEVTGEEKVQGEIKDVVNAHQGYWRTRTSARRIAVVRPRSRDNLAWLARRRTYVPREFRMSSHAPIIQTREVISRVTQTDGTVVEESLQNRFVLARTVATQTRAQMFNPVMLPVLTFENIVVPEVEVVIDLTQDSDADNEGASSGTPLQDEH